MWREVVAVLLVGVSLHAQTQATNPQIPVPKKPVPRIETYQHFTQLRRGTTEDIAIVLVANGFVTTPRSPVKGIVPVSLTLDAVPGFSLAKVNYPKPIQMKFAFRSDQIPAHGGGWFPIATKLKADKTVALGPHTLSGTLQYQVITKEGVSPVQQMPVMLPVTVVEHNALVTKAKDWPFYHMPPIEIVGLVVLCIVLLPIFLAILPFYMICMSQGKCD